jgi:hypothetical protein
MKDRTSLISIISCTYILILSLASITIAINSQFLDIALAQEEEEDSVEIEMENGTKVSVSNGSGMILGDGTNVIENSTMTVMENGTVRSGSAF